MWSKIFKFYENFMKKLFFKTSEYLNDKKLFLWFASIRHKISKFQKKNLKNHCFLTFFWKIFLKFFLSGKILAWVLVPIWVLYEDIYVFRIIYEHFTRACNDPATIDDFWKIMLRKNGIFFDFFFLIFKYNFLHNCKFLQISFFQTLELYICYKKIFYDLRTNGTNYEILKKKLIIFFGQFLAIFADFLNIYFFEMLI